MFHLGPWGRTQTNAYLVRANSTWALVDAGWEGDGPRIQVAVTSLLGPGRSRIANLGPSVLATGHGRPLSGGGTAGAVAAVAAAEPPRTR